MTILASGSPDTPWPSLADENRELMGIEQTPNRFVEVAIGTASRISGECRRLQSLVCQCAKFIHTIYSAKIRNLIMRLMPDLSKETGTRRCPCNALLPVT
jgi:hypothetical protein